MAFVVKLNLTWCQQNPGDEPINVTCVWLWRGCQRPAAGLELNIRVPSVLSFYIVYSVL